MIDSNNIAQLLYGLVPANLIQTHTLSKHSFSDKRNAKVIRNIEEGHKMSVWENRNIYKLDKNNSVITEKIQINSKRDRLLKTLKFL